MLKKYLPVNFLFNVHLSNFNNDVMVTVSFLTYNWHNIQVKPGKNFTKTTDFRKLPNCVKTEKTKKPIKTNYTSNLHLPFSLIFSQATRDLLLLSIISLLPDANWIFLNKYWRNVQFYFKLSFLTASGLSYSQLRANVKKIASFTQCHYRVFIWDSTLCQQEFQRGIGLKAWSTAQLVFILCSPFADATL